MSEKLEDVLKISDFSLFKPNSKRALYEDYPELQQYKELKDLSRMDLLFVWYYACQASPLFNVENNKKRCDESIKLTYNSGSKKQLLEKEKDDFLNGKFPIKISAGIDVMRKFRIGTRIRAKISLEKSIENIEKLLNIDASDDTQFVNASGEVDWAKKKSYIDFVSTATKLYPELISITEGGFGVSMKSRGKDEDFEDSFMDEFHEQNG